LPYVFVEINAAWRLPWNQHPDARASRAIADAVTVGSLVTGLVTQVPIWIVAVCAFLFGYTTLIGWAYYGEQFLEYIFGPRVTLPYRWVYCILIVFGAIGKVELIWAWGDLMNGLQIFPNLVGVIGLSGIAAATLRDRAGTPPTAPAVPEPARA
jgi:Na+/alanine symporter